MWGRVRSGWWRICAERQRLSSEKVAMEEDGGIRPSIHSANVSMVHEVPLKVIIRPIPPVLDQEKVESLMGTIQDTKCTPEVGKRPRKADPTAPRRFLHQRSATRGIRHHDPDESRARNHWVLSLGYLQPEKLQE
ncbi:sulfiredoxin-1 isoform X2 [Sceloporus undulatus]|uniref:sulfiredoxin-1 isoform X2 n=1 Tax=Sceloporus undulatus TaxID=8520 RepID=UPI001C4B89C4|nr:sulfiredoxin-1 isoform X2 [Sceloporus undulatus]